MRFAGFGVMRCAKHDSLRIVSEGEPKYYLYLIENLSPHGKCYVEVATDLKQSLQEHDDGKSSHITKLSSVI
jgi:predicted GIY-YIG superfamily endonuclease